MPIHLLVYAQTLNYPTTPTVPSNAVMDIGRKAPRCVFVNSTRRGLGLQQPVKVHDVLLCYKSIIVKNALTVRCGY